MHSLCLNAQAREDSAMRLQRSARTRIAARETESMSIAATDAVRSFDTALLSGASGAESIPGASKSGAESIPDASKSGAETIPGASKSGAESIPGASKSGTDYIPGASKSGTDYIPGAASSFGTELFPNAESILIAATDAARSYAEAHESASEVVSAATAAAAAHALRAG